MRHDHRPRVKPNSTGRGESSEPALPTAARIEADQVSYRRGGRQILHSVSLVAQPGRVLAITGPSGSGKSTLLALLAGLDRPDTGTVRVDGHPVDRPLPGLGLVLQAYGLVGALTAAENVQVPLQARGLPRTLVRTRAQAALEAVALSDVQAHLVDELSGGQQQRAAIARALATDPALLIVDEPTAELDQQSKQRVLALFRRSADRGATVVLATHDRDVAAICDHALQLVDGAASNR